MPIMDYQTNRKVRNCFMRPVLGLKNMICRLWYLVLILFLGSVLDKT